MIKIIIECSSKINNYLEKYLVNHNIIIGKSNQIDESSLIIKEVNTYNDLDYLKEVKEKYNCHVICIVESQEIVFDIMDIHPLSIWRKVCFIEDSNNLTNIIENINENKSAILEFKSNMNTIVVDTSNIIYIESFSHYLIIHTINSSFRIRKKISDILIELKQYGFIQIHKSYIVNKSHIVFINSNTCELSCHISVPIGKKYRRIILTQ